MWRARYDKPHGFVMTLQKNGRARIPVPTTSAEMRRPAAHGDVIEGAEVEELGELEELKEGPEEEGDRRVAASSG